MVPTVTKFAQNVSKRPILKLLKFYDRLIIISEVITMVKYVFHLEIFYPRPKAFYVISKLSRKPTLGAETFANFDQIRESLRREKFYIYRFAKVYARGIFQFFLFFSKLVGCP